MSGLENLSTRLEYAGGAKQQGRMNMDKLKTLKRSLRNSYQAATAVLEDGRCFRCLINPDKLKEDYDQKIISIPFEDVRVATRISNIDAYQDIYEKPNINSKTSEAIEIINMQPGDVFKWKENGTFWLVTLRNLEETAYFRADIRRCRHELTINNTKYKISLVGPTGKNIDWITKSSNGSFNKLNYDATMYITKTEESEAFLHRFTIVEINNKPWEVQAVDSISMEGILQVTLKEFYQNSTLKETQAIDKQLESESTKIANSKIPEIIGDTHVYPYDTKTYQVKNIDGGVWNISNSKARIKNVSDTEITIDIVTGRSGEFDLIYTKDNEDVILHVIIDSL